ncbi:hypothetical protein H0A71_06425 [Alcaligenaceae bacterium]|nr:hypothetical protein [Alcaligenaceae bacterium]
MGIMLGNLTIEQAEERSGVTWPDALKEFMKDRHQPSATNVQPGKWHCFDAPFTLVCGDMETAQAIYDHLSKLGSDFKEQLQIALAE